jgi:Protein of unknown function (DUF3500)
MFVGERRHGANGDLSNRERRKYFPFDARSEATGSVLFAFDDEKQRVRWSNFPTAVVPRAGLSMGEQNAAERSAALALISSVLI